MTWNLLRWSQKLLIFIDKNLFIIGNLNMATENTHLNALLQIYDFSAAYIQEPTLLTLTTKNQPKKNTQKKKKKQLYLNIVKLLKLVSQTITN